MKTALFFLSFLLPLSGYALEKKPWFGNVLEFLFNGGYTYSEYSKVDRALVQLKETSNDNLLDLELSFPPWPTISTDFELQFFESPRESFGYSSFAAQIRYQLLDDLLGDIVSLSVGFNYRNVSSRSIRDVSVPYHSKSNVEFNISAGKEWSREVWWIFRTYAFLAFGWGSTGSPWNTLHIAFQGQVPETLQLQIFGEGYLGYGSEQIVNICCFNGYGPIQHRSIDLGVEVRYLLGVWGSLGFEYRRRVFARSFPENVNFFTASYRLPFSIF